MREIDRLIGGPAAAPDPQLVSEIQYALSQSPRQLPSRLLYDELGSALFDAICHLPWYRVTRAEQRLLQANAQAIVDAAGRPTRIVELGAGNGEKLATLIEEGWPAAPRLTVELVDVSDGALRASRQRLSAFEYVDLVTWALPWDQALAETAQAPDAARRTMVLFLGSNIGNLDPPDAEMFLRQIRAVLAAGDTLLLGTDLVKDERALLDAYDDPLGVTAAFNRNLLVRLNRDFGANFDIRRFAHRAIWNAGASRIEMHLVSGTRQTVRIPVADLVITFAEGESIWTERSYKYDASALAAELNACGFRPLEQWRDDEARFAVTLAAAV